MQERSAHCPQRVSTLPPLRADPSDTTKLEEEVAHLLAALDNIESLSGDHKHPLYGSMRAVDVQSVVRHHTTHHFHQFGLRLA